MRFDGSLILYPPRPGTSVQPNTLAGYPGWWAQRKYNGTRTMVYLSPEGDLALYSRHREPLKTYSCSPALRSGLSQIQSSSGWTVLDGELLHSKTKGLKDRLVVFDLLVHEGKYLLGSTYKKRYEILATSLKSPTQLEQHSGRGLALQTSLCVSLWLAPILPVTQESYSELLDLDEIEGLVLKNPGGVLLPGTRPDNNGDWLIRVRKPHKNYRL